MELRTERNCDRNVRTHFLNQRTRTYQCKTRREIVRVISQQFCYTQQINFFLPFRFIVLLETMPPGFVRPQNLNDAFLAAANQTRQKPEQLAHNQKVG
jgi:hypothetical protein